MVELKEEQHAVIKEELAKLINSLNAVDVIISLAHLENEQYVLDFYDKLNEISVRK